MYLEGCNHDKWMSRAHASQRLLEAIVALEDCRIDVLKMGTRLVDGKGQGLYATEDIPPGDVLLEVPWEHVLETNVSQKAGSI